jgi:lipoprotein NlpD
MIPRAPICEPFPPARPRLAARGGAFALVALLAACATRQPAPVEERTTRPARGAPVATVPVAPAATEPDWRPREYTVKRGDTLYKIALDFGLDYRELAAWNGIENANLIREGQSLRLGPPGEPAAPGAVTTAPLRTVPTPGDAKPAPSASATPLVVPGPRNADNYKAGPKAFKEPYSEQALRDAQRLAAAPAAAAAPEPAPVARAAPPAPDARPAPTEPKPAPDAHAAAPAEDDEKLDWAWPAKGKLVGGFADSASLKGIDVAGTAGQPVTAAAPGKVVYAGTGLRGYGKLIIVKHNATYLSAYAHNRELLVKEGQLVTKGQKIAEMGNTDADQVKLHFEIRRLGKPMDPLKYLPPA